MKHLLRPAIAGLFALSIACALCACSRGYARATALHYLPESCPSGRVYIDLKGLVNTLHLEQSFTHDRVPPAWKPVFEAFEAAKLRPGQEIEDFAVCVQEMAEDEDDVSKVWVAIGGRFGGRDALKKYKSIVQILTRAKDSEVLEKESNGVPYLASSYTPSRKWIAMPTPNVLVFYSDDVAQIASIGKPHNVDAKAWNLDEKTLASFDYHWAGHPGAEFPHSFSGVLLNDHATLTFNAFAVSDYGAKANTFMLGVVKMALVGAIAGSEFSPLTESFQKMTLDVKDLTVHMKLDIPIAKMIEAGTIASSNPRAVTDLFGQLRHVQLPH